MNKFSATDKKYELKAFTMVNGLLDNLLFTFIVIMLLVELFLLVMVLTILVMYHQLTELSLPLYNYWDIVYVLCKSGPRMEP